MASLVVTLALLVLLIGKAADPTMWTWLTGEPESKARPADATAPADQPTVSVQPASVEPEKVVPGPTDEDPEEREGASEQFLALTDGSTELGREEMPAYWRLFGWSQHQSFAELNRRATGNSVLNQFIQHPEEQRGKLFRLDLNVRRVLAYDAPENSAGIKKVYEIWGWTTESKAWLYCVLTAHLPPGMPVGPDVYERVTFAGYFLKVQGYHAAGAGPKDKALAAPLLIGRLSWQAAQVAKPAPDPPWLWWLGGIALLYVGVRTALWAARRLGPGPSQELSPAGARSASEVRGWLANAEAAPPNPDRYDPNRASLN
jgi:hypothetical protein